MSNKVNYIQYMSKTIDKENSFVSPEKQRFLSCDVALAYVRYVHIQTVYISHNFYTYVEAHI